MRRGACWKVRGRFLNAERAQARLERPGRPAAGPADASRARDAAAGGGTNGRADWAATPDQAYHVTATAVNPRGRATSITGSFRTLTPRHTFSAMTSLGTGQVFGVGMPIMVTFSHPITRKAEVERSLEIRSSKPVTGAWYWMSNTQVWFRPRAYWPAHTRVRFEAHLKGVQGARGTYGD